MSVDPLMEKVDNYLIEMNKNWHKDTDEYTRTLVLGNIRGFASTFMKEELKKQREGVIEECAKVADHQKTICGLSMSRQSTCDDIAFNIRKLK